MTDPLSLAVSGHIAARSLTQLLSSFSCNSELFLVTLGHHIIFHGFLKRFCEHLLGQMPSGLLAVFSFQQCPEDTSTVVAY